jgi:hypothetical protein
VPAAFALYESMGVRQVKTGCVADAGDVRRLDENGVELHDWHDGQFQVDHHLRVLREAARHRISINAHEPLKDTGLRRTCPNWISRDGPQADWKTRPYDLVTEKRNVTAAATLDLARASSGGLPFGSGRSDGRNVPAVACVGLTCFPALMSVSLGRE